VTRSRGYHRGSIPCHVCSCSLPSARYVTGCRALLPRYSRSTRLCSIFSAMSSCDEVGVVLRRLFFRHFASILQQIPCSFAPDFVFLAGQITNIQRPAHTNRWRVPPVGQNYQLKGANDPFLSRTRQHNETALCQTFATWLTNKQRRDPGTVHRKQQKKF
jgi:hypothetical protein